MTRHVGVTGLAGYLPSRWVGAEELAAVSGISPEVFVDRYGLRGKHVAAPDEHVSDMAARVGRQVLSDTGTEPDEVDAVIYFGSTWKDFPVWQAAPAIAYRLGCDRAFALELDYVSCGSPVALRVARNMLRAEPELRTVLLVAASRESHLLDYTNHRSRFMYNFGDGAVAAVVRGDQRGNQVLGCAMRTDGALADHVRVPAGGSREPASLVSVRSDRHRLDVQDLDGMRARLNEVSLSHFCAVAEDALKQSGAVTSDIDHVCGIHMKRSMHTALLDALGVAEHRATYLDDTGHMSGVDPLFGLDRAARAGDVSDGDLVLLLAAGTGYTWAASVVRWGGEISEGTSNL